jgi:hypothetical protein
MDPLGDIPRWKYTCLLDAGGGVSRHKQRGMYFKVIDSPYKVEILSPEAAEDAGKREYYLHQKRETRNSEVNSR